MFFSKNARRNGRGPQGNFVFRKRRKKLQVAVNRQLELNPETAATRRQRRLRTAGRGVKVAAALLFLMGLFSAGKIVVKEAFMENPHFRLKTFQVTTNGSLSETDIIAATGLAMDENILSVSLVQVKKNLEERPEVKSAKVARVYPSALQLDVVQRRPVAWLACKDKKLEPRVAKKGCLLDAEGYVLPCHQMTDELENLPVIRVQDYGRLVEGQQLEASHAMKALQFLQLHEASQIPASVRIDEIDTGKSYAFMVKYETVSDTDLAQTGLEVTVPHYEMARHLDRLTRIIGEANRRQWNLATLNLLVESNIPATFHPTRILTGGSQPVAARTSSNTVTDTN